MIDGIKIIVRGYHLDVFKHINNARILEFMEDARWAVFEDFLRHVMKSNDSVAIVNSNINYRKVASLYQSLWVDGKITKIGNKSFTMQQNITCLNTGQLIADATFICVIVDNESNRSTPIRSQWKELLSRYMD